jgi:hypothetical protein
MSCERARDRDGAVTVICECTRGRRCAMRACRCTTQAIAPRRRLSPRRSMVPGASVRLHACTRTHIHTHTYIHIHTHASSREHTGTDVEDANLVPGRNPAGQPPRDRGRQYAPLGYMFAGAVTSTVHGNTYADTHTHTQGRDAGAGRESSGVAKGARTLSGSRAEDCEHDRGRGGVACSCCHR